MPEAKVENVVGAVIFFSYIVAALAFTALIGRSLIILHTTAHIDQDLKDRPNVQIAKQRRGARVFFALSLLSFAALSYFMLSFLTQSYARWSQAPVTRFPNSLLENTGTFIVDNPHTLPSIWVWSKQSTLFKDFGETIVNDPRRFWWTQQALLYSLGWNIYMAVEGTRYRIPHLWAYFVLSQILPISFTQNLFCAAMFLNQDQPSTTEWKSAAPGDQAILVLIYLVSLATAAESVRTARFFFVLFTVRILLFLPYWMMRPTTRDVSRSAAGSQTGLYWRYRYSAFMLAVGGIFLQIRQTQIAKPWLRILQALGDGPAVSALGCDYIIGILSLVVFIVIKG